MTVIAMTREIGSLGGEITYGVAAALDLKVLHHEAIEHHLAEKLHTSDSLMHRYVEGEASVIERWRIDRQKLVRHTKEELLAAAVEDDIIIRGWGAASLLRPAAHVLRVRVCAPLHLRVERLASRIDKAGRPALRRMIEHSDGAQANAVARQFGHDWTAPDLYHIVLNTESLPVAACISQLTGLARTSAFRATAASNEVLTDMLLATRIRIALDRALGAHHQIDVQVERGEACLASTPGGQDLVRQAAGIARSVKGIGNIFHGNASTRLDLHL